MSSVGRTAVVGIEIVERRVVMNDSARRTKRVRRPVEGLPRYARVRLHSALLQRSDAGTCEDVVEDRSLIERKTRLDP